MKKISVLVCVYNESKRIRRFLDSFSLFDEIILLDKSSTDDTVKIAEGYKNVTVIEFEYSDRGDLYKYCAEKARNEWLLFVTCSDVVHPKLVEILNKRINYTKNDLIYVPYMIHCFGICSPYSAFDNPYRPCLAKKSVCVFQDKVHEELNFNTQNIGKLPKNREIAIHHLTHQAMESSFERMFRYSNEELKKNTTPKMEFRNILSTIRSIIRRKFWKIKWDGLALALLCIQYRIFVYLRVWLNSRNIDIEEDYNVFASKLMEDGR